MSLYPGNLLDVYAKYRIDDLLREAQNDRLANQLAGSGQPLRLKLAEWLRAAAQRLEGSPQLARA